METTDSGLLVPDGTRDKRREVWPADDARLARRAAMLFGRYGLQLAVRCPECKQFAEPQPEYASGDTMLECGCCERHLTNWWWHGAQQEPG